MANLKPCVEGKFKACKRIIRCLNVVQDLSFSECREYLGQEKKELKKRLYDQLSLKAVE